VVKRTGQRETDKKSSNWCSIKKDNSDINLLSQGGGGGGGSVGKNLVADKYFRKGKGMREKKRGHEEEKIVGGFTHAE